jgi:uncharacterized protein (TIGR02996 family)
MHDRIALLKQLRESPDDGLRLAYADYLEEYEGFDGFGEFVSKMIATPSLELMAKASPLTDQGERICELFTANSAKWFGIDGLSIKGVDVSNNWLVNMTVSSLDKKGAEKVDAAINITRGYANKMSMYWRHFQHYGDSLVGYYPVVDVVLRDFSPINNSSEGLLYGRASATWFLEDDLKDYDLKSKLPKILFDGLVGGVWERHSPLTAGGVIATRIGKTYPSTIVAKTALSASALRYARDKADVL